MTDNDQPTGRDLATSAIASATTIEDGPEIEEQGETAPIVESAAGDENRDRRAVMAGWAYLAVLFAIFVAIALFAFDRNDAEQTEAASTATTVADAQLESVSLVFVVSGETVTLQGAVPDEGARDQLVALAEARYGAGNVVDELTIDAQTTTAGGVVNVTGTAIEGDPDPEGLQADFATLGLDAGSFDVTFTELELTPVTAEAAVSTTTVLLTGSFPDQASLDQFVLAAENSFGAENVDASALVVNPDTTLASSRILITGVIDAGDTRGQDFEVALQQFFGGSEVDSSALAIDTGAEALGRLEARLRESVQAQPILFASGSAEIDSASDETLQLAAVAINGAPGVNVEIVGHTDDQGDAGLNQLLSEDRANAVRDRLIELGIDADRLTARGAGEAEPIADNSTDEGRAANRRIEFEFEGAADPATDEAATDEESTG